MSNETNKNIGAFASRAEDAKKAEQGTQGSQTEDFDLGEFIAALDEQTPDNLLDDFENDGASATGDLPIVAEQDFKDTGELNATMSYEALGESYPELPFATRAAQADVPARNVSVQQGRLADAGAVRALSSNDSYAIRGGGAARGKSPVISLALAAVVVVGVIAIGYALFNLLEGLTVSTASQGISLTPEQTRAAVDNNIPVLASIANEDFDTIQNGYLEQGLGVFANSRYSPDSPDPTAQGRELILLPGVVSDGFIAGFYQGSYSAYSLQELEQYFNGARVLDMTRGDLGSHFKLKYVNLNALSLSDEVEHLAKLQGLSGDGVTVVAQGSDSRGNTVRQGTWAIGDAVFYWKIAACPFAEVYSAAKIGNSAVYISVTVATYDFYTGGDEVK